MKIENQRFYKGSECSVCGVPITIKNKSGKCRKHLGSKMPVEIRKKFSKERMGKNNPNWKGDMVGVSGLHSYIKRHYAKPELCENCKERAPFDLANISQKYKRKFFDWEWLCRKCHMAKDGRIKNLKQNENKVR